MTICKTFHKAPSLLQRVLLFRAIYSNYCRASTNNLHITIYYDRLRKLSSIFLCFVFTDIFHLLCLSLPCVFDFGKALRFLFLEGLSDLFARSLKYHSGRKFKLNRVFGTKLVVGVTYTIRI